ncbi:Glycosyltransferase Type 1 [Halomicronema hongdechloris C2206]|uniref:Glycosyltransferase Type 1 n=1 Tax=Halomicronema hongdechloris C2206 TaxID=1641165 RepID=A0A1Z3HP40_9CYAN|nr:glycosyltransferase [Halomicronema hongdechloris]ASC72055.1 Glycosyltransferase Type 1 [Halomicronema hongdechloris C2206]
MRIGFLQTTDANSEYESGVTRYGRLLAQQGKKRGELDIQVVEVKLTAPDADACQLKEAGHKLSTCNVVHGQFSKYLWGGGWQQWQRLRQFLQSLAVPLVVTMHDIDTVLYSPAQLGQMVWQENQRQRSYAKSPSLALRSTLRQLWQQRLPDSITLLHLVQQSDRVLVCTQEEAQHLQYICGRNWHNSADIVYSSSRAHGISKLQVIPHFVEEPVLRLSPQAAKDQLGLNHRQIVTLQGFISRGKGHRLAIEALAQLPDTVMLIFAGMATSENQAFLQELRQLAADLGVTSQLLITGYLDDETLARYLWASDLALCPFSKMAASGSLSTWIALGRPILASQWPQIEAYNQLEPGAIRVFTPYTATALAKAINAQLQDSEAVSAVHQDQALARLRGRLHIAQIFEEHLTIYKSVMALEDI